MSENGGMAKLKSMGENFAIQSICSNHHKTKPAEAGLFFCNVYYFALCRKVRQGVEECAAQIVH